jgi:hypothetical protein
MRTILFLSKIVGFAQAAVPKVQQPRISACGLRRTYNGEIFPNEGLDLIYAGFLRWCRSANTWIGLFTAFTASTFQPATQPLAHGLK